MTVHILKDNESIPTPTYATDGSAGFDIEVYSFKKLFNNTNIEKSERGISILNEQGYVILMPAEKLLAGTGYSVAIPVNSQLEVRSRSGKTLKEGLIVLNAPGTIDADYRGEVGVILYNSSDTPIKVLKGDKVAQAVLMPYYKAAFNVVTELPETVRGTGGYGSTDKTN